MSSPEIEISDNPEQNRFEAKAADGSLAGVVEYELRSDGAYRLVHAEVDDTFEGEGVAGRLAAAVMGTLRERDARIVPDCPYIASYMRKHPETRDLLADGVTL